MDIKFDGKRVLVTGAGKGIGREIVLKLAECGAQVVAVSRTQADLDSLKQQAVAKDMIKRGDGGSIVMMSSMLGYKAWASNSMYCCTKGALDQLTRSLALELGPHKIRVNSVNPTVTLTPLAIGYGWDNPDTASRITDVTPLGRLATVEDVANATLFLLSEKSSMITGSLMPVDGGITIRI